MRLAVAVDGSKVSPHFGHCEQFLLITTEGDQIVEQTWLPNPGHQPGFLPRYLAKQQVHCIIVGGMGRRAQQLFQQHGIRVLTGAIGNVEQVVQDFLAEKLELGPNVCDH